MWLPVLLGPWAVLLALSAGRCRGLSFHLPPLSRKCLKEELHRDVMVTGEYEVSEAAAPGIRTNLKVGSIPFLFLLLLSTPLHKIVCVCFPSSFAPSELCKLELICFMHSVHAQGLSCSARR